MLKGFFNRDTKKIDMESELESMSPTAAYAAIALLTVMADYGFTAKDRMPEKYVRSTSFMAMLFALVDFIQAYWNKADEQKTKKYAEVIYFLFRKNAPLALETLSSGLDNDVTSAFHKIGKEVQARLEKYRHSETGLPDIDDMYTEFVFFLEYIDHK